MDNEGNNRAVVSRAGSPVDGGELSPDGKWLAYQTGPNAAAHVWTSRSDGTHAIDLGAGGAPSWSPDSSHVVFTSANSTHGSGRVGTLATVGADGTDSYALSQSGTDARWSPDGSRLVFIGDEGAGVGAYSVSAHGGAATPLVPGATGAVLSPDGSLLAFTAGNASSYVPGATFVAGPDGSHPRRLDAPTQAVDSSPSWSPDGASVLVERAQLQGHEVSFVSLRADGGGERAVYRFSPPDNGFLPRWGGTLSGQTSTAALALFGGSLQELAGAGFTRAVARVKDTYPGVPLSAYIVDINWGDHTASTPGQLIRVASNDLSPPVAAASSCNCTATGTHTYASPGAYAIRVRVSRPGASNFTVANALAAWGRLLPVGRHTPLAGESYDGQFGFLTMPAASARVDPITGVVVDWGDGTPTSSASVIALPGTAQKITQFGQRAFSIRASHLWRTPGRYTVKLTADRKLSRNAGDNLVLTADVEVDVAAKQPPADFTIIGAPVQRFATLLVPRTPTPAEYPITSYTWDLGEGGTLIVDNSETQQKVATDLNTISNYRSNPFRILQAELDLKDLGINIRVAKLGAGPGLQSGTPDPDMITLWKHFFPRHILPIAFGNDGAHTITLSIKNNFAAAAAGPPRTKSRAVDVAANCIAYAGPLTGFDTCDTLTGLKVVAAGPHRTPDYLSYYFSVGENGTGLTGTVTITAVQPGQTRPEVFIGLGGTVGRGIGRGIGSGQPFAAGVLLGYVGPPVGRPADPAAVRSFINGVTLPVGGTVSSGPLSAGVYLVTSPFNGFGVEYTHDFAWSTLGLGLSLGAGLSCSMHVPDVAGLTALAPFAPSGSLAETLARLDQTAFTDLTLADALRLLEFAAQNVGPQFPSRCGSEVAVAALGSLRPSSGGNTHPPT